MGAFTAQILQAVHRTALRLGKLYEVGEFSKARLRTAYLKDPYDEHTVEALLKFYIDSGQKAAALRLYDEYEHTMRHELGLPPEEHIKKLVATLH